MSFITLALCDGQYAGPKRTEYLHNLAKSCLAQSVEDFEDWVMNSNSLNSFSCWSDFMTAD